MINFGAGIAPGEADVRAAPRRVLGSCLYFCTFDDVFHGLSQRLLFRQSSGDPPDTLSPSLHLSTTLSPPQSNLYKNTDMTPVAPPGRQIVAASLLIDRSKWAECESRPGDKGRIRIPLSQPDNLDTFGLRGRRISRNAKLSFGNWSHQEYIILDAAGNRI